MTAAIVWAASGVLVATLYPTAWVHRSRRLAAGPQRGRSVLVVAPERLGGWLRRRLLLRLLPLGWVGDPALPPSDLTIGVAAVVAAGASPLAPLPAGLVIAGVAAHSAWERKARTRRHNDAVARGLPDVIDRLSLAVRGGFTLRQAVQAGQPYAPEPFFSVFAVALERHANGEPWAEALRRSARALGPVARPVLTLLVAAENDGAPIADALVRAGDEARRRRRSLAEQRARRLPVLTLFPLVVCILPAFGLLTVAPVLYATLRDLELPL